MALATFPGRNEAVAWLAGLGFEEVPVASLPRPWRRDETVYFFDPGSRCGAMLWRAAGGWRAGTSLSTEVLSRSLAAALAREGVR